MVLYPFPLSLHHFNKTAAYGSYMVLQLCTEIGAASSTKRGAVGHFMHAGQAACRQMKSVTVKFCLPRGTSCAHLFYHATYYETFANVVEIGQ